MKPLVVSRSLALGLMVLLAGGGCGASPSVTGPATATSGTTVSSPPPAETASLAAGSPSAAAASPQPSPSGAAGSPSAAASAAASVVPTIVPSAAPSASVDPELVDLELGDGPFDLGDLREGLAALASYRARLTMTFTGTRNGQPVTWSSRSVMDVEADPKARLLAVIQEGDGPGPASAAMAEVDGYRYDWIGPDDCAVTIPDPEAPLADDEPGALLSGVFGADRAGQATINGTTTDHYTFDERALGQAGRSTSAGELWVASSGGYVVRYILATRGGESEFGTGIEGTISYEYDVTTPPGPIRDQLPAGCPTLEVDAPLLPDATDVVTLPGSLQFDAPASVADAVAFYARELPKLGWVLVEEPAADANVVLIEAARGGASLLMAISARGGGCSVAISVDSA